MKAILEFDLIDEREKFELALNGHKFSMVAFHLDQHLRGLIKYAPDTQSEDTHKALQETRDKLYQLLNEYNLEI